MTSTRTPIRTLQERPPRTLVRKTIITLVASAGVLVAPLPASAGTLQNAAPTVTAQVAVRTAIGQVGKPYRWGGAGPGSYDCSGLTMRAYAAAGRRLPHSARGQSAIGRRVSRADLRPGDLLFYYRPVSHVAMYIGNGRIVHASSYAHPVYVTSLAAMPGFAWATRVT